MSKEDEAVEFDKKLAEYEAHRITSNNSIEISRDATWDFCDKPMTHAGADTAEEQSVVRVCDDHMEDGKKKLKFYNTTEDDLNTPNSRELENALRESVRRFCCSDEAADNLVAFIISWHKSQVNEAIDDISLCNSCYCMTHTVCSNMCGKCGGMKWPYVPAGTAGGNT